MNTQQTLAQLVDENFVYASVLYHFGIPFFEQPMHSLAEVCRQHGISEEGMIHCLEQAVANRRQSASDTLPGYPVDLIIQYLQNAHQVFIKQRLPYLGKLIGHLSHHLTGASAALIHDLKFVYPLFAEDFIHHIY
ncbi:MAG: iron-sulfur cluster repair di-iron protein, partial [Bacteroidota bacterium]